MEYKTIKTIFFISEFEEEEKWLASMHSQGWKLIDISHNKYKFEKCQPEDWVYQLDFQNRIVCPGQPTANKNNESSKYIELFRDYGWSFILQNNHWFYFKRKKDTGDTDTDLSIFSDRESKITMCERILNGKLKINVVIFCIACMISILTIYTNTFTNDAIVLIPKLTWINDFLKAALPWIGICLLVASSYSFSGYRKLKGKINLMKNPLE